MCVCFQGVVLQREHALRFTRRLGNKEQTEGPSWVKRKEKERNPLVVAGSQICCKKSCDGDHLDKNIPTPPNKMWVRKQEKHTPIYKDEPRSQITEGWQLRTLPGGCGALWVPWHTGAPPNDLGEGQIMGPAALGCTRLAKGREEDRKLRNLHFHNHFPHLFPGTQRLFPVWLSTIEWPLPSQNSLVYLKSYEDIRGWRFRLL